MTKYIKFFGIRYGCKLNDIKHFEQYLPNQKTINIICEPFAGSFALIRKTYKDSNKKLHINDNDSILINTMLYIKDHSDTVKKVIEDINNIVKTDLSMTEKKKQIKEYNKYDIPDYLRKYIEVSYCSRFIKNIACDIDSLKSLLNKIEITNKDVTEIMEQYKDDKKAFLFFDPPYLDSDNTRYKGHNKFQDEENRMLSDNTTYYIKLLEYIKVAKCKIMIIINANAITEYLYKDYIKGSYFKIYQITKNKTKHLIITNYK